MSDEYFQLPTVLEAAYSLGAFEKDCHTAQIVLFQNQHILVLDTEPSITTFQPDTFSELSAKMKDVNTFLSEMRSSSSEEVRLYLKASIT